MRARVRLCVNCVGLLALTSVELDKIHEQIRFSCLITLLLILGRALALDCLWPVNSK